MIYHHRAPAADAMRNTDTFSRELSYLTERARLRALCATGQLSANEAERIHTYLMQSYNPLYTLRSTVGLT